jgi:hypothetical protein
MKIPAAQAIIPREKLTKYLLVYQPESDKSQFLAQAGFTQDNPEVLDAAIRDLLKTNDAVFDTHNRFGDMYRVEGTLKGVNDHDLLVVTVWIMRTEEEGLYRFVTLKPWRKKNDAT